MATGTSTPTSSIIALVWEECPHIEKTKKILVNISNTTTVNDLFYRQHPALGKQVPYIVHVKTANGEQLELESGAGMTVGEVVMGFDVKSFIFSPNCDEINIAEMCNNAQEKAIDAFEMMMSGGRGFPNQKSGSLNAKQRLFNDLLVLHKQQKLDFPKQVANSTGDYVIQVICNALWYITNHHTTIQEAATKEAVKPLPGIFLRFKNLDDYKAKKTKKKMLSSTEMNSHAQTLYKVAMLPMMRSSPAWIEYHQHITQLADCLQSYSEYLNSKNAEVQKNHSSLYPVRQVSTHTTVEFRKAVPFIDAKYSKLNDAVMACKSYVFFDEDEHLQKSFINNSQRLRSWFLNRFMYLEGLNLTVPVDMYRFTPGGGNITVVCFVKSVSTRTIPQLLTDGARFCAIPEVKQRFKEYHTRQMKKEFKEKLNNIASVQPAVADFLYKELALDATVSRNPVMAERMRLIFLGNKDLIQDLRQLNPGRPGNKYDTFFQELAKIVEEVTIADDRRHGLSHLATWISLRDLIQQCKERLPDKTAIPSKELIRLQFSPKNPYSKTALSFTSKFEVQYKIQRRQLRAQHIDQHYAAAQFKYLRQLAVDLTNEKAVLLFADDKAKIPIGEPGKSVSTGVRGKKTLTPSTTELVALDHDMNMSSLTPSVILHCDIPSDVGDSFVKGKVMTTVNDSVFQSSSPWRHAATFLKLLSNTIMSGKVLILYTDGGTDHRHTLEAVRLSLICLFIETGADMLVAGRCAPGHSFTNPAERVMSVLNLGLQNCSLERDKMSDENEATANKCNSMKSLREHSEIADAWSESLESVIRIISNRFRRLQFDGNPIEVMDSILEEDIHILKNHANILFPTLDVSQVTKISTAKCPEYLDWKLRHCRERHYSFQIRKCSDENCCTPKSGNGLDQWLPDPELDHTGEHYRPYEQMRTKETEDNRPSLQEKSKKDKKASKRKSSDMSEAPDQSDDSGSHGGVALSAQNARATVECVECRKPRVVYSCHKISTDRQKMALALAISEFNYTCGGPLLPSEHSFTNKYVARPALTCQSLLEIPYYGAGLGPLDLCGYCAHPGAIVNPELIKKFKTVLPICDICEKAGKKPFVARPFGKNQ